MKLGWATDIHLNLTWKAEIDRLCAGLIEGDPAAVLISGDIAEAPSVEGFLRTIEAAVARPVYFVLGNHDYYDSSIAEMRARMPEFCRSTTHLRWMNTAGIVPLTEKTALVGHDGWGDAREGKGVRSSMMMTDFIHIRELFDLAPEVKAQRLGALGDEAAAHFRRVVPEALEKFEHVLVLTHVPPFRETCLHDGQVADDDHLPYYVCKATGEVLRDIMRSRTDRRMTVVCGHTHSEGRVDVLPNLHVRIGGAVYKRPRAQKAVEVP